MYQNAFNANAPTLHQSITSSASTPISLGNIGDTIRIVNEGPGIVFCAIRAAATNASLPSSSLGADNSCPILGGSDVVLSINSNFPLFFSAISRTTAEINIQVGAGV